MSHHTNRPARDDAQPGNSNGSNGESKMRRRVLVVDDNVDSAESLGMLMALEGHDTLMASDGEDAVAKAVQFDADAILLDLGLPKLSGHDACRAIRKKRAARQPVMIALSGWGQDSDRKATAEAGFDAHVVKPPEFEKLLALLQSLWSRDSERAVEAPSDSSPRP